MRLVFRLTSTISKHPVPWFVSWAASVVGIAGLVDCTHAEKHSMFVSWLGAAWMAAVISPVVMLWRE